jgi:probable HAF family extracellular repeat protein
LPGGYYFSIAEAVSGDGSRIVGLSSSELGEEPYRWTQSDGMRSLGAISGTPFPGWAFDISDDGNVVVGGRRLASGPNEAFAWTEAGGRVDLGDVPGGNFSSAATGVSQNGDVIVGSSEDENGQVAFMWDSLHGIRRLEDVLRDDYGINTGIRLYEARDVSADGRTIVGAAFVSPGKSQAYVVTLPFVVPEPSSFVFSSIVMALLSLSVKRSYR